MKKLLALLVALLCLCPLAQAEDKEEYVLKGWQGNVVMTQSGIRARRPISLTAALMTSGSAMRTTSPSAGTICTA